MQKRQLKQYANKMRSTPTPEERTFSHRLIDLGIKFKQQAVIGPYIADFLINNIVIEIDGKHHFTKDGMAHDRKRTEYLNKYGYEVIRIVNSAVNKVDIKKLISEVDAGNVITKKRMPTKSKAQRAKDRIIRMVSKMSEQDRAIQARYDRLAV